MTNAGIDLLIDGVPDVFTTLAWDAFGKWKRAIGCNWML